MKYPGRVIKTGESDGGIVRRVKQELIKRLVLNGKSDLQLDAEDGNFDGDTKLAVKLFQSHHVDGTGRPLKVDGDIGSLTWAALFGEKAVPVVDAAADSYLRRVLHIALAAAAANVREIPPDSNRGPEVERYLKSVGLKGGYAWCVAFVYCCFDDGASALQRSNPMVRTAGVLDHWNRCVAEKGARRITRSQAVADPGRLVPGMIFVMDHGGGYGHSGLIEAVKGGIIATVEGNTDASLTREGGGVYRLKRKVADINKGFIDYAGL